MAGTFELLLLAVCSCLSLGLCTKSGKPPTTKVALHWGQSQNAQDKSSKSSNKVIAIYSLHSTLMLSASSPASKSIQRQGSRSGTQEDLV